MNPFTEKICGVAIMAGGRSQRMGQDKMLLEIAGETLLERMTRAASGAGAVYIVGREKPEGWPDYRGEFLPDDEPNLGPVGGLRTLLRHIGPGKRVIVIAGDLPRLTMDATLWLRDKAEALIKENRLAKHGLIVLNAGQWEPLFAVYSSDCLPLIEENIAAGRRSLRALIERGDFSFIHASHDIRRMLRNNNTPEEWAAFQVENKMTFDEARKYVEDSLRQMDEENVKHGHESSNFLIIQIMPFPYGWVFFWSSQKWVETAAHDFAIIGNAPYFILRTGEQLFIPTSCQPETFLGNWEIVNGWRGWTFRLNDWDEKSAKHQTEQLLGSIINKNADEIRFEPTAEGHQRHYYRSGTLIETSRENFGKLYPVGLVFWKLRHMAKVEEADEYNYFVPRQGSFTVKMHNDQKFQVELLSEYTPLGERLILRFQAANKLGEKVRLSLWRNQK